MKIKPQNLILELAIDDIGNNILWWYLYLFFNSYQYYCFFLLNTRIHSYIMLDNIKIINGYGIYLLVDFFLDDKWSEHTRKSYKNILMIRKVDIFFFYIYKCQWLYVW